MNLLHVGRPGRDADGVTWVDLATAWRVLAERRVDVVLVSLALPAATVDGLVVGLQLAGTSPAPALVGVCDWDTLGAARSSWRLDAVSVEPRGRLPGFVRDRPSVPSTRAACAEALGALSFLAPGGAPAVAAGLRRAFGGLDCAVALSDDNQLARAGDFWADATADQVRQLCERIAGCGAPVIAGDRTYLGVRLRGADDVVHGVVCLAAGDDAPGFRDRDLLTGFASRAAAELGALHRQRRTARAVSNLGAAVIRDDLEIYSRSFVNELLALELARSVRQARPVSVAVLDVVGLRAINARHGHAVGDGVLRELDAILRDVLRAGDVVGRFGDDALAVILPETSLEAATRALARPCEVIHGAPLRLRGGALAVAVHLKIAVATAEAGDDPDSLLERAAAAARRPGEILAAGAAVEQVPVGGPQLAPGRVVGNTYRILHVIGEGGVGRVYRAEDITLQRPVALKVLRPELAADPAFLTRFRSEATLLAAIQHPNLVQIFTFGETAEGTFFAMELVEGETLAEAVARAHKQGQHLPLARLLDCLAQIASALDRLHESNVLHRDVKPDNIALDPFRERAVLLDVGVAKHLDRRGDAAGTPGFVAPEVAYGKTETPASDVFGLAVTAYQALTFRFPWTSFEQNPAQIIADESEPPRRLSALRPDLDAADELFERSLSFDPTRRPASAGELVALLEAALRPLADEPSRPVRTSGRMVALAQVPVAPIEHARTAVALGTAAPVTGPPPLTRGIVFKSLARVIGAELPRWLEHLATGGRDLIDALSPDRAAQGWSDARLFFDLLDAAETLTEAPEEFARRFGRAVLRSSFQRFFPASTSTLTPERIVGALPIVWSKYQTWGKLTGIADGNHAAVALDSILRYSHTLAPWLEGLLAQTVVLCGGEDVVAELIDQEPHKITIEVRWKASW